LSVACARGTHRVDVEYFCFGYDLCADGVRVASFREGRIGYRLWATKTGRINPSVEDRYDHDVDELMA
jgi:hypothetical protein